jgi:uncharacterized C2H2 Zn-finger protein
MEKHAKEKHNNVMAREKWSCIFCGETYLHRQGMQVHVKRYHRYEVHFCPRTHCGMHYKTDKEVQAHVKKVHENAINDEKIPCTICGRRVSSIRYVIKFKF